MDDSNPNSSGAPASAATPRGDSAAEPSVWHRPVSYRVQCWVAWAGLTAFGARGLVMTTAGAPLDIERLIAVALSVVWGIDLLRARSAEV